MVSERGIARAARAMTTVTKLIARKRAMATAARAMVAAMRAAGNKKCTGGKGVGDGDVSVG